MRSALNAGSAKGQRPRPMTIVDTHARVSSMAEESLMAIPLVRKHEGRIPHVKTV
jgi:hypothetical protein